MTASPALADNRLVLVDRVLEASVAHGVARITLAQTGPDGEPMPAGRIAVPLARLPAVAGGLLALLRKLEEAGRECSGAAHRHDGQGEDPAAAAADRSLAAAEA